jgi:hypothetical protein
VAIKRAGVAAVLMAVLSLFMPDKFKSGAVILPDRSGRSMHGLAGLGSLSGLGGLLGDGGLTDGADANYPDILLSRWVCGQLLKKEYTFNVRSWRFGPWKEKRETLYKYLGEPNIDRAVAALLRIYSAEKSQKSHVITMSVETNSPELSRDVAAEAVRLLEKFMDSKVQSRGEVKALFIADRLEEAKREYLLSEQELGRFMTRNRNYIVSADPAVQLEGKRLEEFLKIRGDQVSNLLVSHEQALMEAKDDTPVVNVLDDPNLPVQKSRPTRSLMVVLAAVLVGGGSILWDRRQMILDSLRAREI